jgi:periplasmic protein TonB
MLRELEITSTGLGIFFLVSIIVTVGIIVFFKIKYKTYNLQSLLKANSGKRARCMADKTKFPEVDVFRISDSLFSYGLLLAVSMSLVAMNWTSYEKKIVVDFTDLKITEEVDIEIPRTTEPPLPPPPPPPPVIQEVPNTEVITEEQPIFENMEVTVETKIDAPLIVEKKAVPAPPPPPPPPAPVEDEIFKVVEQMPRFPGCENKQTEAEKSECAKAKLLEYIYSNLKYPIVAIENGIEGQVVLQFVVETDGSIKDINIVRDIGGSCGEAAENVIKSMNKMGQRWTPGKQRGRPVRVLYTLPVKFIVAQ